MRNKLNNRITIIALTACVVTMLMMSGCTGRQDISPVTNTDIINYRDFALDAGSVNLTTRVSGTVFVKGDLEKPEDVTVRIVASVSIDPADWSGVNLYFPEGWRVTSIDTSVIEIDGPYYSDYGSAVTSGQPEQGGWTWVAIGYRGSNTEPADTVRQGTLVIDADYVWEDEDTPELLDLTVSVGSKDGYIAGPVHTGVEVPLLEDIRPVRLQYLFPRQWQAEDFETIGEITGELTLEDNELRVDGYLVLWPKGCHGWSDTETVWIKDSETGNDIARVGDILRITGKEVDSRTASSKASDYSYPGYQFEGPFWLASKVVIED